VERPLASSAKASILIVDDVVDNLKLLKQIIAPAGYEVRVALGGEFALRSIQACLPDLIFLDIRMPGIDGLEVCQRLKADEKTAQIPIIFISATGDADIKAKCLALGGADFITKPYSFDKILVSLDNHLPKE
jgi:CheY-like chemotaxis protein